MLGAYVPVSHALRFFRAIRQHSFAFVAQRKIDRSTGCRRGFRGPDLRFERRYCLFRLKQPQRKGMILMEQPEQQMLRFNKRATASCGLIPPEENYSARSFRVALE